MRWDIPKESRTRFRPIQPRDVAPFLAAHVVFTARARRDTQVHTLAPMADDYYYLTACGSECKGAMWRRADDAGRPGEMCCRQESMPWPCSHLGTNQVASHRLQRSSSETRAAAGCATQCLAGPDPMALLSAPLALSTLYPPRLSRAYRAWSLVVRSPPCLPPWWSSVVGDGAWWA